MYLHPWHAVFLYFRVSLWMGYVNHTCSVHLQKKSKIILNKNYSFEIKRRKDNLINSDQNLMNGVPIMLIIRRVTDTRIQWRVHLNLNMIQNNYYTISTELKQTKRSIIHNLHFSSTIFNSKINKIKAARKDPKDWKKTISFWFLSLPPSLKNIQ